MAARAWQRLAPTAFVAALVSGVAGCAPIQRVPLQLDPPTAAVYVDGELQPGADSGVLALRSDRSHVLFVKREGYRSQQIVLTSEKSGEGHRLVPDRVRVTLRPVQAQGRSLRIDVDDEGSAPPSDVDRP